MLANKNGSILIVGTFKADDLPCMISGYNIYPVANYEEAVECLNKQTFDYVITDATFKGRNTGLGLLKCIKELPTQPKVYLRHLDSKLDGINLMGYVGIHFDKFAEFHQIDDNEHWNICRFLGLVFTETQCA